jgi:hypothetical protein
MWSATGARREPSARRTRIMSCSTCATAQVKQKAHVVRVLLLWAVREAVSQLPAVHATAAGCRFACTLLPSAKVLYL